MKESSKNLILAGPIEGKRDRERQPGVLVRTDGRRGPVGLKKGETMLRCRRDTKP